MLLTHTLWRAESRRIMLITQKDADGIVREDLLLTMSEKLNEVTDRLEKLGLVILKDKNGKYVTRGNRNLKINGENIKPILASAVEQAKMLKSSTE